MPVTPKRRTSRVAHFDSPEQEAYLSLWRTYDRLRAIEDDFFAAYELTAQQYNALRLLRAAHPATVPTLTLAGRLISRAPDITRMLDRLEQRGLVARQRRADNRRVVDVAITPAGLELLSQMAAPLRECHSRQLGHLSADDLRALVDLLRRARAPHEDIASVWE
jgi:DNA-binding MarR family transcriptional regulator